LAASVVIWWLGIAATVKLAINSDAHTHVLLTVPISAVLIYLRVKEALMPVPARRWIGAVLLGAALLLGGYTAWNTWFLSPRNCLALSMLALVLWWIGAVIICFGVHAFRALRFPLVFLFLAVPLPEQAVNAITQFLQHQSAVAAELLFRVARVPVTRESVLLSIPGLDIEVAHECSSIRSSTMLIVITLDSGTPISSFAVAAKPAGSGLASVIGCKKCCTHLHDRGAGHAR
jgi:exosortase